MKDEIKTEMFRLDRWKCYLLMLVHQAPWVAWSLLAVVVALAAVGFILSPWIGVAAIGFAAFIVVMVMSFVIFAYGFYSITGVNTSLHSLALSHGEIRIEFDEGDPVIVDPKDVRHYRIFPGGVVIPVKGAREGWLWLPPKAFVDPDDFQEMLKRIYASNTEQEQEILLHDGDGGARL